MGKGGIEGKWSKDPITKARVIIIRELVPSEYTLELAKENRGPCMLLVIDHYQ